MASQEPSPEARQLGDGGRYISDNAFGDGTRIHQGNVYNYSARSEPTPVPSSTVPFRRDPDFVDRDILPEIHQRCSEPASRVALVGLGGVGKSQLAIEYSYRVQETSPETWVFWVHASSHARFEEGYKKIADRVRPRGWDDPKADILRLVSSWLCDESNGRWIMIVDNADDSGVFFDLSTVAPTPERSAVVPEPQTLSNFLPQSQNGSILITSRRRDLAFRLTGSVEDIIAVKPMDKRHALALLRKKLGNDSDEKDVAELALSLDYMPLAITQAAAYIRQRAPRYTVSRYLRDLRASEKGGADLLKKDVGDSRRDGTASNSIMATWQISFEHIRRERPSAAQLLSLMSLFDRQGIPEYLLYELEFTDGEVDSDTHTKASTNRDFEEDLFTLTSYSLISSNVENNMFEMHRLVQFSTKKWLELRGDLERWKEAYIRIIYRAFPSSKFENWTVCQALFPHAEVALAYRPVNREYLGKWAAILKEAASYAGGKGNYIAAEEMVREALDSREMVLGKEHPDTLICMNNLAGILEDQGKHREAEPMYRQTLALREKLLGNEHPDTLTSMNDLALLLGKQGKYHEAEPMHRQTLALNERVLGKEHPNTLTNMNNLAALLQGQGKCSEAEPMYRQTLALREKVLGKEHHRTLSSMNNLALLLNQQGKYKEAEPMYRQTLALSEKVLGSEHPGTLTSMNNFALLLESQGKYSEAEPMHRQTLALKEKVLGKEHPSTLTSMNNLASLLEIRGKYNEAELIYRQTLGLREKVLGKEHPDMLLSVYCFAYLFHRKKQYHDASALYQRACTGYEKILGLNHPTAIACSKHYSAMLNEMEAKDL